MCFNEVMNQMVEKVEIGNLLIELKEKISNYNLNSMKNEEITTQDLVNYFNL